MRWKGGKLCIWQDINKNEVKKNSLTIVKCSVDTGKNWKYAYILYSLTVVAATEFILKFIGWGM